MIYNYHGCCGAKILYGFTMPCNYAREVTKKQGKKYIRPKIKVMKTVKDATTKDTGIISCILNHIQKEEYHDDLIELGWKCIIEKTSNPLHNSRLWMYVYVTNPIEETKIAELKQDIPKESKTKKLKETLDNLF